MLRQIALTAALLSLYPAVAQEGLRAPDEDRDEADRKENRIAPKSADRAARPLVVRKAMDMKLKVFDERVAPCAGGFVVREGKEFVKYDAAGGGRTALFAAKGEVSNWWSDSTGTKIAYKAEGKIFLRDGTAERELPGADAGGVTFSGDGAWVAWSSRKAVWLLALGREDAAVREIPIGAAWQSNDLLAISTADGKLWAVVAAHGTAKKDSIGVVALEGKETEFAIVHESGGSIRDLEFAARGKALLFLEATDVLPARMRVKRMEPDGSNAVELFAHDKLGDISVDPDGSSVWIPAPGANGRWQVWRSNVRGIGTMKELDQESIANDPDGDCLAAVAEPGSTAYYVVVKNPDGAFRLVRWTQE